MEGWLDGSRACHHCPSLGVSGFKGFLRSPATWMEAQSPRQRPILDPPSPVIGSQASQISTHATTACSGLLSALDSTRLTPPQEPEFLQQRATPSTTFPPSNDGTALQLFAAAHRLPGHIGSHDFVSHIRPGNGDVFPSALGPIPLRFFDRPPYTSRGCRRPLPYYWTSTVWVPGLLISLRLVHGGVSAGTLPRPPLLLGPHASQRDWKCGLGSRSTGGCRYCLAPSHKPGLTFRDCRRLFLFPQHQLAASPSLDLPATYRQSTGSAIGLGVSKVALPASLGTEYGTVSGAQQRRRLPSSRLHPRPTPGGWISCPLRPAYLLRC